MTTVAAALAYKERLQAVDPSINYLMTLYLHESITPEVVREAKKAGIAGIKVCHPNSLVCWSIPNHSDSNLVLSCRRDHK